MTEEEKKEQQVKQILTEEEQVKVQEIEKRVNQIMFDLGQNEYKKYLLLNQIETLDKESELLKSDLDKLADREKELYEKLKTKYDYLQD